MTKTGVKVKQQKVVQKEKKIDMWVNQKDPTTKNLSSDLIE